MAQRGMSTDANFALVGKDFVMVAADTCQMRSIVILNDNIKKLHTLSPHIIMSCIGTPSDTFRFHDYVTKRRSLYKLQNRYELSTEATVNFACRYLAENLRSPHPLEVATLIAGYDAANGAQLYFMDHFGAMVKMQKAGCHGYGGLVILSILDRYWKPTLTQEEAYDVVKDCVREVQTRLVVNLPSFAVKVVDKYGVCRMPTITVEKLAVEKRESQDHDKTF